MRLVVDEDARVRLEDVDEQERLDFGVAQCEHVYIKLLRSGQKVHRDQVKRDDFVDDVPGEVETLDVVR